MKRPLLRRKRTVLLKKKSTWIDPDDLLTSEQAVANACGVSRWTVTAVKKAAKDTPDNPFSGRYTTKRRFTAWVLSHPRFRARHYMRKGCMPPTAPVV